MNFNDIFKSSFINQVTTFSIIDFAITIALAVAIGLFIMAVYKKTFKGVLYSQSFSASLMALTLITTVVILAVASNVVLSLGMVGALSIVRFRSAIKEPIDISFLFWSIAVGIILGAGLIPLAICGSLVIGLVMVLFVNKQSNDNPYILVISCEDDESEKNTFEMISKKVKKYIIKSKTVSTNGVEITVEIRLKDGTTSFVNEISRVTGVKNTVLVSYNGDYMS